MKPRRMQLYTGHGVMGRWWHLVSRVVDRNFVFGEVEREMFAGLLRRVETFSGVEVITWTMLSNHFHIVLYVPEPEEDGVAEGVFWQRLLALYGGQGVELIREKMEAIRRRIPGSAGEVLVQNYRESFVRRMRNLSEFMKTLLQRFSTWFNRRHQRVGRLWESRFKSLLIEGQRGGVMAVAAYVDLNAVRAELVQDPKDYRWCGYAEAVAGRAGARKGLMHLYDERVGQRGGTEELDEHSTPKVQWREVSRDYRKLLYGIGGKRGVGADGKPLRAGPTERQVKAVLEKDGALSLPEMLRCRIRYFSDGVALGSRGFIDAVFKNKRAFFGKKRRSGARKMRGGDWQALWCLRDLQIASTTSCKSDVIYARPDRGALLPPPLCTTDTSGAQCDQ